MDELRKAAEALEAHAMRLGELADSLQGVDKSRALEVTDAACIVEESARKLRRRMQFAERVAA